MRRRSQGKRSRTCAMQLCLGEAGVAALRAQAQTDRVSVPECVATRACKAATYYGYPAVTQDLTESLSSLVCSTQGCERVLKEARAVGSDGETMTSDIERSVSSLIRDLQVTYETVRKDVCPDRPLTSMETVKGTEGPRTIVVRLSSLEEMTLRDIASSLELTPSAWVYVSCTPLAPNYLPFDMDLGVTMLDELSRQVGLLDELAQLCQSQTVAAAVSEAEFLRRCVSERLYRRVVVI